MVSARNIDDKIVNGQDATQGQFPYQVRIRRLLEIDDNIWYV